MGKHKSRVTAENKQTLSITSRIFTESLKHQSVFKAHKSTKINTQLVSSSSAQVLASVRPATESAKSASQEFTEELPVSTPTSAPEVANNAPAPATCSYV